MTARNVLFTLALVILASATGCNFIPSSTLDNLSEAATQSSQLLAPVSLQPTIAPTETATPSPTITPTPTPTEVAFPIGEELTVEYLRELEIEGSEITFEQELTRTFYYERHIVSYLSEGNRIYGLLTIPRSEQPPGGFKAIVFNHGYIPPQVYRTAERYTAYVDYLARSGFVVFKIDFRGHGNSEGEPSGSYYSPGYTIDSIAALKSLQTLDFVDPQGIGMWGHSMAGNVTLRAMLVEPDVKAGVIWAGAVYSYDDFAEYGITDNSYRPPPEPEEGQPDPRERRQDIFDTYGGPDTSVEFWRAVSLTENIEYLTSPLQIHHSQDDSVVSIAYSEGLVAVLQANGKEYQFYSYEGGGHNLISPFFGQAMLRTVEFFREHL